MSGQPMVEKLQQSADRINGLAQGGIKILGGLTMFLAGIGIARESAKLGIDASQHETLQSMIPAVKSMGYEAGLFLAGAVLAGPIVNRLDRVHYEPPVLLERSGQQG